MNGLQRFIQTVRASRRYGQAQRLAERGRHAEAAGALRGALGLLPPDDRRTSLGAAAFSVRLSALMLQARVAASLDDVPLALESIRAALPLWTASGAPPSPKLQSLREWEAWAREYLDRHR